MGQSVNLDEPPAAEAQRDNQISGVRLPPGLLVTWWERVLAVVAIALVVWTFTDVMRHGL